MANLAPSGWEDVSAIRYMAPATSQQAVVGKLLPKQVSHVRDQMTVVWETIEDAPTLEAILQERPLYEGIQVISQQALSATRAKRVYRFNDPLDGTVIQQSQEFVLDGRTLYTMTITSDPIRFGSVVKQMQTSKRTITLAASATHGGDQ